jgi:hypothetical protein
MPAIPHTAKVWTEKFNELCMESSKMGETNDCTVKAICVVTGATYADVHARMAAKGRQRRKGAFQWDTHAVIRELGFTCTRVKKEEMEAKYDIKKTGGYIYKQLTTHHLAVYPEAWKDGHAYIIHTSRHVSGAVDGTLHDWAIGRAKRIQSIYRIEKA